MVRKKNSKDPPKNFTFRSDIKSPYKTLKITLKSILKDKGNVLPLLNDLVFNMNDLVIHTYQFIRFYILYLYDKDENLPEINDTFILYCMKTLGLRDNRGKKATDTDLLVKLETFYNEEYQPLLNHQKINLKNKSYILPYLATGIHTSLSNNISERFLQHLFRFINKTTTEITTEKSTLFRLKSDLNNLNENINPIFNDWKSNHLSSILPVEIKKSIAYDVKVNPFHYLKGMLYMNHILEGEGSKLYQPLPLRSNIIPKHITFDTACIINLFCEGKGDLLKNLKEKQNEIWSNFLNIKHRIFKNKHYSFNNQIQTDGISCCLLFIHNDFKDKKRGSKVPVLEEQDFYNIEDLNKEQLETLKDKTIIGCDPGKRSLVYMVDEKGKKLQYTAPQRRRESKTKCNQRIMLYERKKNGITKIESKLSEENSRTVNYQKFKEYLIVKDKVNKETLEFYKKDTWRKMNFRTYCYTQKSIDNFLNRIETTFGNNILIGYGNWSRSSQMKNFVPTINKGLRKLIHKRYDTITINECNTSKKCCDCHSNLEYYKDKDNKKIFRLLTCIGCVSSDNKKITFKTRDLNSSVNILKLTKGWLETQNRPEAFRLSPSIAK
jgi:hypothetical protein